MTHCNGHLPVQIYNLKGTLCDSLGHTTASTPRFLLLLFLFFTPLFLSFCFSFAFCFSFWRGRSQGQQVDTKEQRDEWEQGA